jgi:hypothetical protein
MISKIKWRRFQDVNEIQEQNPVPAVLPAVAETLDPLLLNEQHQMISVGF